MRSRDFGLTAPGARESFDRERGSSPVVRSEEKRRAAVSFLISIRGVRRHVSDRGRGKLLIDPPVAELFLNVRQILEYFSLRIFILSNIGSECMRVRKFLVTEAQKFIRSFI